MPNNKFKITSNTKTNVKVKTKTTDLAYANRIQACRLKLGWPAGKLSHAIGTSILSFNRAERNGTPIPEEALAKLAKISNMPYRWLLNGTMVEPVETQSQNETKTKDRRPRCYIAGPISSDPNYRLAFQTGKAKMIAKGYDVISPVDVESAMELTEMTRTEIMNLGIYLLSMCDTIALLPGHEKSKGCAMELAYAIANDKTIIEIGDLHAQN